MAKNKPYLKKEIKIECVQISNLSGKFDADIELQNIQKSNVEVQSNDKHKVKRSKNTWLGI